MKSLISIIIAITLVNISFAQDTAKQSSLSQLLATYLDIKNALVGSDAAKAAAKATEFVKALAAVDMNTMSESDLKAFNSIQPKLKSDAQTIATTSKIELQRNAFSTLSNNVYTLAKSVKLSVEPVYQQYCPMKKMYWLSSEAAIKNPYYGNAMLTCGSVTDTLK